ncbi:Ribonuclease H-like domain [Plasmopara halstedii]|uniref:Ribonuclease H-like domain n=1 Tax=Plasmopara halstedii TaxID=4781 RepID=A0A0P1B5C9_PLAHL|nr:Ribonuclease H-like domain [Plasmopara halstedii]CEG48705.1 Ribonuclease H-like domain [Plasmopara halstedii]|eukprot:XP_024585074.1 Ribonuclease H-like domain [Plasmopara halstedii]
MRAVIAGLKASISNNFVPDLIHEVANLLHPLFKVVAANQKGVRAATLAHMGIKAAAFPNLLHQETETGLDEAVMEGVRLPTFISFAPPTSTGDGKGAADRPASLRKTCSKRSCDTIWDRSCLRKKSWKAVTFRTMTTRTLTCTLTYLATGSPGQASPHCSQKLASFVLAIPASSAECERTFNTARFIKSVLRSALSSDSLEGNVVLRDNPNLLAKYLGEIKESDTEPE